jgi:hypothetical protein
MALEVIGATVNSKLEVDATTRAAEVQLYPESGTYFQHGWVSGTMAAGLAAASPVFAFRYTGDGVLVIKKLLVTVLGHTTAFAAGDGSMRVAVARGWTASDTGGNAITFVKDAGKLRINQNAPQQWSGTAATAESRVASTATLTAGTRTLDTNTAMRTIFPVPATASARLLGPNYPLIHARPGQHPFVLSRSEGIVMEATVPITGTWVFALNMSWLEQDYY